MTTATKEIATVAPFGIEAVHPQMCDLLIQSIPGCRIRSRIGPTIATVQGHVRTPTSQGHSPPEVPGMQLHVNPADCTYVVHDPLNDDENAKSRIRRYLQLTTGARQDSQIRGPDTVKGKLDPHRMKTLCREILWLLEAEEVRMVKGPKPDLEDVDELPGKYLLNPGLQTQTTQPTYEDDYPAWLEQLTRSGG